MYDYVLEENNVIVGVNKLCWADQSERMINHYYQLRDFAAEHTESSEIFSAID